MIDPAWGPFLFDTSADSWLARSREPAVVDWLRRYLSRHEIHVSAVTLVERVRGYGMLLQRAPEGGRGAIEAARFAYMARLGKVWPLDSGIAIVAGDLLALLPHPPTGPRQAHRLVESRQDRQSRWRFDILIAATALTLHFSLVHNNAEDFEAIRNAVAQSPERFPGLRPLEIVRCASLV